MRKVQQLPQRTGVSVQPTSTVILNAHVPEWALLTVELLNQDVSQVMDVSVWRRLTSASAWSQTSLPDFAGMQPGESRCADIDIRGTYEVQLRATASGAGLSATVAGILVEVL
jgi:hypothetical protein